LQGVLVFIKEDGVWRLCVSYMPFALKFVGKLLNKKSTEKTV
jgi:hypothetical protein